MLLDVFRAVKKKIIKSSYDLKEQLVEMLLQTTLGNKMHHASGWQLSTGEALFTLAMTCIEQLSFIFASF